MTQPTKEQLNHAAKHLVNYHVSQKELSASDARLILDHIADKVKMGKVKSIGRVRIIADALCVLRARSYICEYKKVTTDAVIDCCNEIQSRGEYERNSARNMINVLYSFINWGCKSTTKHFKVDRDVLKEYQKPAWNTETVKPSDVLDDNKINAMIAACQTARDRAIVTVFAETGCRPKELINLKWSDVTFTGKSAQFRLVDAKAPEVVKYAYVTKRTGYIVDLQTSQQADAREAFIFRKTVNSSSMLLTDEPLTTVAALRIITKIAQRAGVPLPKGAKCKILRASSVTNKLKAGVPKVAIEKSHWAAGTASHMMKHYDKYASNETEAMFLAADGQAIDYRPATVDKASLPWICIEGHQNPAGATKCIICGKLPDGSMPKSETEKALEAKLEAMEAKYNRLIELLEKK